jgi:hypothetical protein
MIGLFVAIFLLFRRCVALCGSLAAGSISFRRLERFRKVVRPGNEGRLALAPEGVAWRGEFVGRGSPPPARRANETPLRTFAGTTPSIRFLRPVAIPIDPVRRRRPLFVRLSSLRSRFDMRSVFGIASVGAPAIAFS